MKKFMQQRQCLLMLTLVLGISMAPLGAEYEFADILEQQAAKQTAAPTAEEISQQTAKQTAEEAEMNAFTRQVNTPRAPKVEPLPEPEPFGQPKVTPATKTEPGEFGEPAKPSKTEQFKQQVQQKITRAKQAITDLKQRITSSPLQRAEQQVAKSSQELSAAQAAIQKAEDALENARETYDTVGEQEAQSQLAKAQQDALQATKRSHLAAVDRDAAKLAEAQKRLKARGLPEAEKPAAEDAVKRAEAQLKKTQAAAQKAGVTLQKESRFSKWLSGLRKAPQGKTVSGK